MQTYTKRLGVALMALVMAVLTAAALSGFTASQAYAAGTSQAVTIEVRGHPEATVTYTVDQLADDEMLSSDKLGYQYKKPSGDWFVVGITDYIELDALFEYANVDQYWTTDATLQFTCTDGEYTKYYPTYEECTRVNYFYAGISATGLAPTDSKVEVPTVLGFSYAQQQIASGSTAQQTLDSATFTASTRFGVGCTDDTINAGGDGNMGKRMPQDITKITIIPADAAA